jgi:hypothetical protein
LNSSIEEELSCKAAKRRSRFTAIHFLGRRRPSSMVPYFVGALSPYKG